MHANLFRPEADSSGVTIEDPYMDLPPGPNLWNVCSFHPLLRYIFGSENVEVDQSEPIVHYPSKPGIVS
jgi:hypothetical protein